ncbi:hypothetical protein POM88_048599 [Heracleum sosnowskyi]|uniref:Uncharacterized protein n=1 Tax=Heracleum sosnowskyi TaxID=360622 RepID=A0AAD8GVJ4_9APIA|nr:hypothetical protein POM88_048599 [Heracleum sosnowskyi]
MTYEDKWKKLDPRTKKSLREQGYLGFESFSSGFQQQETASNSTNGDILSIRKAARSSVPNNILQYVTTTRGQTQISDDNWKMSRIGQNAKRSSSVPPPRRTSEYGRSLVDNHSRSSSIDRLDLNYFSGDTSLSTEDITRQTQASSGTQRFPSFGNYGRRSIDLDDIYPIQASSSRSSRVTGNPYAVLSASRIDTHGSSSSTTYSRNINGKHSSSSFSKTGNTNAKRGSN